MKSATRILTILTFVLVANMAVICGAHANSIVTLRGEVELTRPTVRLSDVFVGVPDLIDREIAQAPLPGKRVVYDITVLNRLVQMYRLDWQPQSSSDHATIVEASTIITSDAIRAAVIEKLKEQISKGDIEVSFDNRALEVDLPADQSGEFTLNNFQYDSVVKRFHADLVTQSTGGSYSLPVLGKVMVKRNVPVLSKRLEGGTVIGAHDIDWLTVPEERVTADTIMDPSELIGRELRRDSLDDQPIHSRDIMPPRFVTRGTLVTLKIETPFMLITSQGKALQDGVEGDTVRVLNTQSNRMVEGKAEAPGVVVIHTTQQLASVDKVVE